MKAYGIHFREYIKELLQIKHTIEQHNLHNTSQIAMLYDNYNITEITQESINVNQWLDEYFECQQISQSEFLAWLQVIKTQRYNKINALVLLGPTNSGKSMLMELLIKPFKPELIPRENYKSSFHLDQLPLCSCVLFEEPLRGYPQVDRTYYVLSVRMVLPRIKIIVC